MVQGSNYFFQKALAAMTEHVVAGNFSGPLYPTVLSVGLFKSNTLVTQQTLLAGLTEADFSGYLEVTPVVWESVYLNSSNQWVLSSGINFFQQNALTISNTVYGWFLVTSADGGQLLLSESFPAPVQMNAVNRAIQLSIQLQLGGVPGLAGSGVLIDL